MSILFLIIIYLSFISLGLPDSLLGSAWPVIHGNLSVPLSSAGLVSMIIAGGTIISSFFSGKIIRKFGTGKVTFISVAMTAFALLGFSKSPSFIWLCIFAIPLGLGAGAVDSALNNFVALHYKAKHMNWLHCFWGIGATLGPIIMSYFIAGNRDWRNGYLTISIIQFLLVVILFCSLPMWKKSEIKSQNKDLNVKIIKFPDIIKIKGVKVALLSFFCYCAAEATTGLWGSTYLVKYKGVNPGVAAKYISMFYFGITLGRFISGFIAIKISNKDLIRIGQTICVIGIFVLLLPLNLSFSMLGLTLIGLGCAPIYPSMLHETPNRFGGEISQSIMGIQMAFAYIGTTFVPPIFGLVGTNINIAIFPIFILIIVLVMIISSEYINKKLY